MMAGRMDVLSCLHGCDGNKMFGSNIKEYVYCESPRKRKKQTNPLMFLSWKSVIKPRESSVNISVIDDSSLATSLTLFEAAAYYSDIVSRCDCDLCFF